MDLDNHQSTDCGEMTDKEQLFKELWEQQRGVFEAWGRFVQQEICAKIEAFSLEKAQKGLLKLPVQYRLKETDSLLEKAFRRGKNYIDPIAEIEDKVGLRVVVLSTDELFAIKDLIENMDEFLIQPAKDFKEEIKSQPSVFEYQSIHYVLRPKNQFKYEGVEIYSDTTCELQLRTLLQHAHSELTHDTVYKPTVKADSEVVRAVSKSMALLEVTDDYFSLVKRKIDEASKVSNTISNILSKFYLNLVCDIKPENKLNFAIIDFHSQWINIETFETDLGVFLDMKKYIPKKIKQKSDRIIYFRQPAILLVYFCVSNFSSQVVTSNPIEESILKLIFSDIGAIYPEI